MLLLAGLWMQALGDPPCLAQPLADGYGEMTNASNALRPVDECQVIARVNGEVILSCELLWQVNLQIEEAGGRMPPGQEDEIRQQLMQQSLMQMMDMRMIYSDFRRNVPQADLSKIHESLADAFDKDELPRLMKVVGVEDRQNLEERLASLGTSLRERREDYYKVMIARSWISEGLKYDKEVTHQHMLDYYHEHTEDYEFPTQAKWEELMVRYDRFPSDQDAYVAICGMGKAAFGRLKQAKAATDPVFEPIAKQQSQGITASEGGQHDWTTQGALAAEVIDEALFVLPVGQMSPILRSDQGFHIVHVLDRKLAGVTPFTEVQNEIRDKIRDQRFSKAITQKLRELKKSAYVWTVYTGQLQREEEVASRAGQPKR